MWELGAGRGGESGLEYGLAADIPDVRCWLAGYCQYRRKLLTDDAKAKIAVFEAGNRGYEGTPYQSGEDAMAGNGYTGSTIRG